MQVIQDAFGGKAYNVSGARALPYFLSAAERRRLRKDDDYRRRVELLQGFEFPTASQKVRTTRDGNYVIAVGTYPPSVKVFETAELSMKCERRLDCEVVDFLCLGNDYAKLAFLCSDRTVAFHAAYGSHYSLRVPRFGRCMAYQRHNCDLFVGAAGSEVYRISLDEGRFKQALEVPFEGVNDLAISELHALIACGGGSKVHFVDPRSRDALAALDVAVAVGSSAAEVSRVRHDVDGLTFAAGTSDGRVALFDLRSSRPLHVKEHVSELPIVALDFHRASRNVISCDRKTVKIWSYDSAGVGASTMNLEPQADVSDLCVVRDGRRESGLLLLAGEQPRVQSYFLPALGVAPKWCSFIDSMTEELEEAGAEEQPTVYEDYRFLTEQEVRSLGVDNLIGTPLLRGYMHGYFVDTKLYNKLRAVADPDSYEDYKKQRLREKVEAKRKSRISVQKKLPKINAALAERLLGEKKKAQDGAESNPTGDDRFGALFSDSRFQVDEQSEEFRLRNPSGTARKRSRREEEEELSEDEALEKFNAVDESDDEEPDAESPGEEDSDLDGDGESDSDESDSDSDSDGGGGESEAPGRARAKKPSAFQRGKKRQMYEIKAGENEAALFGTAQTSRKEQAKATQQRKMRKVPIRERMRREAAERARAKQRVGTERDLETGRTVRTLTFTPKSNRPNRKRG